MRKPRLTKVLTPWLGLSEDFKPPLSIAGFVYLITELQSGKQYIGRKYFWSKKRVKIKGRRNKRKTTSESDWRYYQSSCLSLKDAINAQGIKAFKFEVLSCHTTRSETNYEEVRQQFIRDVLYSLLPNGEYRYYNSCILNRYYRNR